MKEWQNYQSILETSRQNHLLMVVGEWASLFGSPSRPVEFNLGPGATHPLTAQYFVWLNLAYTHRSLIEKLASTLNLEVKKICELVHTDKQMSGCCGLLMFYSLPFLMTILYEAVKTNECYRTLVQLSLIWFCFQLLSTFPLITLAPLRTDSRTLYLKSSMRSGIWFKSHLLPIKSVENTWVTS